MKNPLNRKQAIFLAAFFSTAIIVLTPNLGAANAGIPPFSAWLGPTAMAHWDVIDTAHGNVTIGIDVVYGQQPSDAVGARDMIYIRVTHVPQGVSEATGYSVNITSGPIWGMNRAFVNATLAFNWTNGLMNHPVAIEWLIGSQPVSYNKYTSSSGSAVAANGAWRSGNGSSVNATMTIGGAGPHPGTFVSSWALVGVSSWQPMNPVAASAFTDVSVMAGQTWYFYANSNGGTGNHKYQWYEGSTLLTGQTSMVLAVARSSPGTYTFTCKVTDSDWTTATSNAVTLTVK